MRLVATALFALAGLFGSSAYSMPLSNGDFSNGLTDWNTDGDVSVVGGAAQLQTAVGLPGFIPDTILVQGDDGFFNFTDPLTLDLTDRFLIFDVAFTDQGPDAGETGTSPFGDNLVVNLYDELDLSLDLLLGVVANAAMPGPRQVVLDVSANAGRTGALSFELTDENDGRDSRVTIDNVFFAAQDPTAVPLPATWLLLGAGLLLLRRYV